MEKRNYPHTITGAEALDFMKEVLYGQHIPSGRAAVDGTGITKEPFSEVNQYELMHITFFTDKED